MGMEPTLSMIKRQNYHMLSDPWNDPKFREMFRAFKAQFGGKSVGYRISKPQLGGRATTKSAEKDGRGFRV